MDKTIFKAINGYEIPPFLDEIFAYLHGMKNVEIVFFLFCLVIFSMIAGSPKKGPRAAAAVFIATMATYFGTESLRAFVSRPYPAMSKSLEAAVRVDVPMASSAFPVLSNMMFAALAMSIIFYFPRYTKACLLVSLVYAILPVYLGVAYPTDAFGSLALGYVFGYVLMVILSKTKYFARWAG